MVRFGTRSFAGGLRSWHDFVKFFLRSYFRSHCKVL